jgi:phosphoribosyl-ATP pyrophosphohydrolase
LFEEGINKIAQKVGEEAVELIIEAKDSDDERFKNEAADLIFHLLVLFEFKNVDLDEVIQVLESRYNQYRLMRSNLFQPMPPSYCLNILNVWTAS